MLCIVYICESLNYSLKNNDSFREEHYYKKYIYKVEQKRLKML